MPATIQLPLDLPDVEVLSTESGSDGSLIIPVEGTLKKTRCQVCRREIDRFHGYDKPTELRQLPILDREVYIRIEPKRYPCPDCECESTTTQYWEGVKEQGQAWVIVFFVPLMQ